jgi:tripartite-type tricarboxylate transporter receptor subunit TctC
MAGVMCAAMAWAGAAGAQAFPDRPIRLIVPFAAGGGSDTMGRLIALKLAEVLGQSVVVENRAGAGGNIGATAVAKAAPDGYTLLMANVALGINAGFPTKPPFDVIKDFSPVALVGTSALVVAVHPSVQARSIPDLIKLAKARPGGLSYSSCGNGTLQHMGAELLKNLASVHMVHIPYRGCSQAVAASVAGDVPVTFNAISNVIPFVSGGQLRLLGVASERRLRAYPDVPTIAEAGFANYDADLWMGIMAPAGTPPAVVSRLNTALNQVVAMPDVQESYRRQMFEPRSGTPEQFATLLQREVNKWTSVIKAANIKPD